MIVIYPKVRSRRKTCPKTGFTHFMCRPQRDYSCYVPRTQMRGICGWLDSDMLLHQLWLYSALWSIIIRFLMSNWKKKLRNSSKNKSNVSRSSEKNSGKRRRSRRGPQPLTRSMTRLSLLRAWNFSKAPLLSAGNKFKNQKVQQIQLWRKKAQNRL